MGVATWADVDRLVLKYVADTRELAEGLPHERAMLELGYLRQLIRTIGSEPWHGIRFALYAFILRGRAANP